MSQTYRIGTLNFTGSQAVLSSSLDVSGSGRFTDTLTLSNPSTALSAFDGTLTLIQEGGSRYLNLFNGGIRYNSTYNFYIGNGTVNGFNLSSNALTASLGNPSVYTLNLTYNDAYRYTISKGVGGADLPNYLDIRTDDYTSGFDYGPVPSPIIRIYSGNNTAVNSSGGFGDLILQHNGTSARGNVLIGTSTTSSFKLDVSGSGRFTNGLYLSGPENHITTASARIQGNSIVTQFDSNGGDSGYVGGYDFRVSALRNPTTSSFRIWGGSERTKVGVGDFTEGNLQAVDAKLSILNDISESNGRNAGIRLITKENTTSTTYNGIRMDAFPLGDGSGGGGAFIGTQLNPATNGYDSDLVILATSATVNSHREIARFVGKSGSLSLGEFPTKNPVATLDVSGSGRFTGTLGQGFNVTASGAFSHAEGQLTRATGDYSHAEGQSTIASGRWSHAEGAGTQAIADVSHAEGVETFAEGDWSHAEGWASRTIGLYTHAEGYFTRAEGDASHAEGERARSVGNYSHAEGYYTVAGGTHSHAAGQYTSASGNYQSVIGQYNIASFAQSAFIIGNGSAENNRSNLLFASGSQVQITGSLNVSGSARITDVLTLPFQDPLPSGRATGSIALSGSGGTFIGMYVYNGTNWVTV